MSTLLTDNIGDNNVTIPMDAVTYGSSKHAHDYNQSVPTIRSSYNVSSITDTSTGLYQVFFTNAMSISGQPTITSGAATVRCGYGTNITTSVIGYTYTASTGASIDGFSGMSTLGDLA